MRESARRNAVRSGIVVLVAAASGYLTWRLIAVPFMERAQAAYEKSEALKAPAEITIRGDEDWEAGEAKSTEGYFEE